MEPRFQCYSRDGLVWWRLLGRNNRSMARSAEGFADLAAALADIEAFPQRLAEGTTELQNDRGTHWQWVLRWNDQVVAMSPIRYGRRLECARAVARLYDLATVATVAEEPLVNRRPG